MFSWLCKNDFLNEVQRETKNKGKQYKVKLFLKSQPLGSHLYKYILTDALPDSMTGGLMDGVAEVVRKEWHLSLLLNRISNFSETEWHGIDRRICVKMHDINKMICI